MDEEKAKEYADEKFKSLGELEAKWNYYHSFCIIKALKELGKDEEKLRALAWVHDIGKINGEENHPEKSIVILKEDFDLDEIDIDCIRNHGSSARPETEEGKVFRYSDGLSLFYPETILFLVYGMAKEGKSFDEIRKYLDKQYDKYLNAYSDNSVVIELLKKKLYFIRFK